MLKLPNGFINLDELWYSFWHSHSEPNSKAFAQLNHMVVL
uniref:Uncharacterized protein n=1 Tax=Anguilla anguilla TaxID=7936 RepID=A0A0E9S8L8_ANGAN